MRSLILIDTHAYVVCARNILNIQKLMTKHASQAHQQGDGHDPGSNPTHLYTLHNSEIPDREYIWPVSVEDHEHVYRPLPYTFHSNQLLPAQ